MKNLMAPPAPKQLLGLTLILHMIMKIAVNPRVMDDGAVTVLCGRCIALCQWSFPKFARL